MRTKLLILFALVILAMSSFTYWMIGKSLESDLSNFHPITM